MTGFNDLCEAYGFPLNPLKDFYEGQSFQRENAFLDHADLPENLVTILKNMLSLYLKVSYVKLSCKWYL